MGSRGRCNTACQLDGKSSAKASPGSVGDAYDNAAAESFVATLKTGLLHRYSWPRRLDAELAIFDYVEQPQETSFHDWSGEPDGLRGEILEQDRCQLTQPLKPLARGAGWTEPATNGI